jgi:type IV pilus assembly protein PilN
MIRVNLLAAGPTATKKRAFVAPGQRSTVIGMLLLVLTIAGVGLWWWDLGRETAALDARITKGEADLARLKNAAKLVDRAIARKAELSEKLALIDRLRTAQHGPVNLISTMSRSMTEGLWLLELTQKGNSVQVEGRATSLTAVTDFVERLQTSGIFDRPVEIVTTSMEVLEESSLVRFAIKAQARGTSTPGPAGSGASPAGAPVRKGE